MIWLIDHKGIAPLFMFKHLAQPFFCFVSRAEKPQCCRDLGNINAAMCFRSFTSASHTNHKVNTYVLFDLTADGTTLLSCWFVFFVPVALSISRCPRHRLPRRRRGSTWVTRPSTRPRSLVWRSFRLNYDQWLGGSGCVLASWDNSMNWLSLLKLVRGVFFVWP